MVTVRCVDVKESRLKRLGGILTEPRGFSLKDQARIQTKCRHHKVGILFITHGVSEIAIKVVESREVIGNTGQHGLGREEPIRASHRISDGVVHVEAIALRLKVFVAVLKAGSFQGARNFKAVEVRVVGVPAKFRNFFIRAVDRIVMITFEDLVFTHTQRGRPEILAVLGGKVLRQDGVVAFAEVAGEVA